ncbi:ATP-binding cassette domain-containing protein [Cognatishimia sp. F0-27]|uniref:thiamine ABC transporter ATP-binding protein n=1 Tax=Cognatishimia sp. F0-27 TaxID=2816855 RepID=UPI001D0C1D6B|nr:ATP-binding cassette domain-containing protein [Cognatishimia sp. F0-27]MCC1494684.1 ATP-binding cassette domain-containing protein [Cognatishimia sp. F0-27]
MLSLEQVEIAMGKERLCAAFDVPRAARVAILGPSGAGKSTLLDVVAGFRHPDRGRILWSGTDMTAMPPEKRPVSILFQDGNLFPHLSVRRNLALALRPDGRKPDSAGQTRLGDALGRVALDGMEDRLPGTLSGGQQSRVALARVLLQDRPLLLLDEPFSALGPGLRHEMIDLVTDVATEIDALLMMVTHDPSDARRFASHIILVADGLAHPPQDTAALFADPPPAFRDYLGRSADPAP